MNQDMFHQFILIFKAYNLDYKFSLVGFLKFKLMICFYKIFNQIYFNLFHLEIVLLVNFIHNGILFLKKLGNSPPLFGKKSIIKQ